MSEVTNYVACEVRVFRFKGSPSEIKARLEAAVRRAFTEADIFSEASVELIEHSGECGPGCGGAHEKSESGSSPTA